jgi:hypothetical protein
LVGVVRAKGRRRGEIDLDAIGVDAQATAA